MTKKEYQVWLERTTPKNIIAHEMGKMKHGFGQGSIHNEKSHSELMEPTKKDKEMTKSLLCWKKSNILVRKIYLKYRMIRELRQIR